MPDGYDARVKVMQKKEARIEVDELDHATFTYEFYENAGAKAGISLPANVTHSIDAYVLRCIHRRCNYDQYVVRDAEELLGAELFKREAGIDVAGTREVEKLAYYVAQYQRSEMADVAILPYLTAVDMGYLTTQHIMDLLVIVKGMLQYKPFEVVTIHDEFKCHPNNMNYLRQQYINVMAELAESNVLDDVLSQLHKRSGHFKKLSNNLGTLIRQSNYALS